MADGQPPTPEELAALAAAGQSPDPQLQRQMMKASLAGPVYRAFESADVTDINGKRVLSLVIPLPKELVVCEFEMAVATQIGQLLIAPGVHLPGQNGGQSNG